MHARSDLRGLTADSWGLLALPVTEFLVRQNAVPPTVAPPASNVFVGHVAGEGGVRPVAAGEQLSAVVPLHAVRPSARFGEARIACC